MEQGAKKILAKHGCLYMKDDYKALFEELEAYYKPTEAVKNNAVLPLVSGWLLIDDTQPKMGQMVNIKWNDGTIDEHIEWTGVDLTQSLLPVEWEACH